tara:strand:- start:40941 stop:41657 length:717 start_codon:yes stop_codon:yes gene_type:complete
MSRQIADGLSQRSLNELIRQYGLGADMADFVIGSGESFDDNSLATGTYFINNQATGSRPSVNNYGVLQVFRENAGSALQIWSEVSGTFSLQNRSYVRTYQDGSWGQWFQQYSQKNILGTVSQSGGVPTGAIIERGSNANGEYTKFADGTLICVTVVRSSGPVDSAVGSIFNSALLGPFPQPATFVSATPVGSYVTFSNETYWAGCLSHPSSSLYLRVYRATSTTNPVDFKIVTIGRWF